MVDEIEPNSASFRSVESKGIVTKNNELMPCIIFEILGAFRLYLDNIFACDNFAQTQKL